MKVEVDFDDCVKEYLDDVGKSFAYSPDDIKEPMEKLLSGTRNYEESANIVLDLLETIPEWYRAAVMEARGYRKEGLNETDN